jgi:DNA-binding transcriptional LysR family regulator
MFLGVAMKLRQIEVFRAVMKTGSFTGAAQMLHISQPGVSRMVRHVEAAIGVRLFERRKGQIRPTPEAVVLGAEIERCYRGVQAVRDCASGLRFGTGTMLRVVTSPNTGLQLVPAAVAMLAAQNDGAGFSLEVYQRAAQMIDGLVSEQVDVAISALPLEHPLLENRFIGYWHMTCVFPADHPLAKRADISPRDIEAYPLVMFERGTLQRRLTDEWFAGGKATPRKSIEVHSGQVACSLVANGAGVAFVDNITATDSHPGLLQHRRMTETPSLKAYAAWNGNRPLSSIGENLVAIVIENLKRYCA